MRAYAHRLTYVDAIRCCVTAFLPLIWMKAGTSANNAASSYLKLSFICPMLKTVKLKPRRIGASFVIQCSIKAILLYISITKGRMSFESIVRLVFLFFAFLSDKNGMVPVTVSMHTTFMVHFYSIG